MKDRREEEAWELVTPSSVMPGKETQSQVKTDSNAEEFLWTLVGLHIYPYTDKCCLC